jgi:hypothetical protein
MWVERLSVLAWSYQEAADEKTECDRPVEGREGRSTRFANGQRDSTADSQLGDRPMKKEMAVIKEIRQKESMVEAGRSMIGNGSRVSF